MTCDPDAVDTLLVQDSEIIHNIERPNAHRNTIILPHVTDSSNSTEFFSMARTFTA